MIIDQLTPTVSDNLTDEVPVEQGTSTFKTTWQKILNLFFGNLVPTSGTPAMDGTASQGTASTLSRSDHVHPNDTSKQDTLVSGTNIKTIGSTSLLGSGDISFPVTSVNTKTGAVALDAEDVGAMPKWVLLWTNPSPMAGFSAQTLSIDLSKYDVVLCVFRYGVETDRYSSAICEKGISTALSAPHLSASGGNYFRYIDPSNSNIVIGQGTRGGVGEVNTACTPYKIYGITI